MLMFQRKFDSYSELLEYLDSCEETFDRAEFEFEDGKWILDTVSFDNLSK